MIDLNKVQFGTDAEVFLRSLTGDPVPVCGMVGGTKDKPLPLADLPDGFAVQEDNAALEINIPPTPQRSVFINNTHVALQAVEKLLPKSVYMDLTCGSVEFNESYLKIPAMSSFGCEPDYNAWTLTTNDTPRPKKPGFRSAAGHIHIGWEAPNDEDRLELIRMADVFVVLPLLQYENESDKSRRTLYGKAGAFRWKEYGVEHRVLSNMWLRDSFIAETMLKNYVNAIQAMAHGVKVAPKDYDEVRRCINECDPIAAKVLNQRYSSLWISKWPAGFNHAALLKQFR